MNKNIFCFIVSMVVMITNASTQFLPDPQKLTKEITQLNQEFDARLRNRIDYLQILKANHYRYSVYGLVGGLITGYCVGLSIDRFFNQNGSKYAIPLTVIGSALGCFVVQVCYAGAFYVIQRESERDCFSHSLKLIRKYSEFFKDVALQLKTLEPERHQLP